MIWIALHLQDLTEAQLLVNDAVIMTADIWEMRKADVVHDVLVEIEAARAQA